MEPTLHTTPSGKSFASKSKEACKVYCQPRHVRRTRRGGWREALTSEMLRSVVIDILIALLVILFRTVLFPLSSPRSPNLLDESQEAVHDWLPGPPRSQQQQSAQPSCSASRWSMNDPQEAQGPGHVSLQPFSLCPSRPRVQPQQEKT